MPITAFAGAAETAEAVRRKMISAVELMTMTLQRIDRHNPTLNAIVWQDRQQAMARATQADAAVSRGDALGALHGVPVTIKSPSPIKALPAHGACRRSKMRSALAPPQPSPVSNPRAPSSSDKRTYR